MRAWHLAARTVRSAVVCSSLQPARRARPATWLSLRPAPAAAAAAAAAAAPFASPRLNSSSSCSMAGAANGAVPAGAGQAPPSAAAAAAPLAAATAAGAPAELFDKEQFRQQIPTYALAIPARRCQEYLTAFNKHLLNRPRQKNVLDTEDKALKLLLLAEDLRPEDFGSRHVQWGAQERSVAEVAEAEGLVLKQASLEVDYSYWSAAAVLQKLLPEGLEVPSSFETVGSVAHLNLRDEFLPYKHVIGQVLLDKNPRLRTVVNKVGTIESEYRVFDMEVLAGDGNTETEVRQHGARFKLDFRKVYWNSRLEREHQRLVASFCPGEVVLDVMAGIGPFAIPAAQKGCTIYANDLNPASHNYLCANIALNRVGGRVHPFCMDGRALIRAAAAGTLELPPPDPAALPAPKPQKKDKGPSKKGSGQQQQAAAEQQQGGQQPAEQQQQPPAEEQQGGQQTQQLARSFDHAVMNLPASAVEFLDAFRGAFDPVHWAGRALPTVHVYTFCRADETPEEVRVRVESHLGGPLDAAPALHFVRDVAPNKHMYCVSFRLPASIAFAGGGGTAAGASAAGDAAAGEGLTGAGAAAAEGSESKRQKVQ